MKETNLIKKTAYFHLPGLFEFYELYRLFLALFYEHREYFYNWCEILALFMAHPPIAFGVAEELRSVRKIRKKCSALLRRYGISGRLTFSNSLLQKNNTCRIQNVMPFVHYLLKIKACKMALSFIRTHC